MSANLGYLEACAIGLLQGVTELFPVSSLGHSVLLPALVGGSWAQDLSVSKSESPYLAFIVGLHVATAVALIIFFRNEWVRVVRGFFSSIRNSRMQTANERLAWMLIIATIPVGLTGLAFEHTFRTVLGTPKWSSVFLFLNGGILILAERMRRNTTSLKAVSADPEASDQRIAKLSLGRATLIGAAQIAALAPGISRSGIAMVAGRWQGLDHEDAARFSFLLATPVILAAGLLKLPDLFGHLGDGIRPQVAVASLVSGCAAYLSVKFLTKYFESRTLTPYGIYCLVAGAICIAKFTI